MQPDESRDHGVAREVHPLFVTRGSATPYTQLYLPVRPGVWQLYENLRQTRG